jgi:uncharacterized protein YndB with AHSA1/START domain
MDEGSVMKSHATVERISATELVITRTIHGPPRLVYAAWTQPELMRRWWVPRSCGLSLLSCEQDVRVGGTYRLVYSFGDAEPMAFYGRYLEVVPPARLVWTNEEAGDQGSVTTVTFEDLGDTTRLVVHERYPSKEALDVARESGSEAGTLEALDQLDELLGVLGAGEAA